MLEKGLIQTKKIEIDGISNNERVQDLTDNVQEECDVKSTTTKAIGELENIKLVQSEVVTEEQFCLSINGIQTDVKKSLNHNDAAARMDEITDTSIYDEVDDSLQLNEEQNDEDPKVEVDYDDGILTNGVQFTL